MKAYPSISTSIKPGRYDIWDKLDGSNIRAEVNQKQGLYKIGSRKQLIDSTQNEAFQRAETKLYSLSDKFKEVLDTYKWQSAVFFFELYGEHSFAGSHDPNETQDLYLLDISPYKYNGRFVDKHTVENTANLLGVKLPAYLGTFYIDNIEHDIVQSTKKDRLYYDDNVGKEGIVCKPFDRKKEMFKVKNAKWIEQVKRMHGNNAKDLI